MDRPPFRRGFRLTEHQADVDRDVGDEISFHHAMRERELIASGRSPEEARREARQAFGDEARIRAEVARIDARMARGRRVRRALAGLSDDVRHALRVVRRGPWFALVAIATLALAIGGNAVVFSVIEAVLLRPPAVSAPDRLASIWTTCRRGDPRCSSSYPDFQDYRDRSTRFSDMAAYTGMTVAADAGDGPEVVGAELVTANYFALLGLEPRAGRLLQARDDETSADAAVLVLSEAWWQSRFGADAGVVGSTLRMNGVPYTVVGVAPKGFGGLVLGQTPDVWTLLRSAPLLMEDGARRLEGRGTRWIQGLVGRLAPGASVDAARADLLRVSDQLAAEDPDARGPRTVTVAPLGGRVGGDEASIASFLAMLQGIVALTLLLACASLANLMVARASARRSEMAVRLALGSRRGRILRQQMLESLILAGAGAVVAGALAAVGLRIVAGVTLPHGVAIGAAEASLNPSVVGFLAVAALVAALLSGGIPAWVAARATVAGVLREQRSGGTATVGRLRAGLIGIQVALGCVMLVGATLFVGTLRNRLQVDLGFDPDNVALVVVDPSLGGGDDPDALLADRLIERIGALPGVTAAAAGRSVPVRPGGNGTFVQVDGYQPAPDEEMRVEYSVVTAEYLRTLGLPIVAGRDFEPADLMGGERVVVIDETMANTWWLGRDPIGGVLHVGENAYRVIGVARRTAWGDLEVGSTPFVFVPKNADAPLDAPFTVIVRTTGDPGAMLPTLRNAIRAAEPGLAIRQMETMRSLIDALLAPQRAAAWLLSAFGGLALLLAAIGIWGVVSHTVARRRRDFGIHMALGATAGEVVRLVARSMRTPVLLGLGTGMISARILTRIVDGFLYGVTGAEPGAYLLAALALGGVAALATLIPARRAAATDPVAAIRAE